MESDIWGEVILIVLSGLLYGMFESMEVAIRAAQKSRLLQWKEENRYGAGAALLMRETLEPFVMTLQIGLTCTGMAAAIGVGALTVGQVLPWLLARWPWLGLTWWVGALSLALAIALLTYVMLVFGQLVPRAIAQQYPERVACRVRTITRGLDTPVPGATDGADSFGNRSLMARWTAAYTGVYIAHPDHGGRSHDNGA